MKLLNNILFDNKWRAIFLVTSGWVVWPWWTWSWEQLSWPAPTWCPAWPGSPPRPPWWWIGRQSSRDSLTSRRVSPGPQQKLPQFDQSSTRSSSVLPENERDYIFVGNKHCKNLHLLEIDDEFCQRGWWNRRHVIEREVQLFQTSLTPQQRTLNAAAADDDLLKKPLHLICRQVCSLHIHLKCNFRVESCKCDLLIFTRKKPLQWWAEHWRGGHHQRRWAGWSWCWGSPAWSRLRTTPRRDSLPRDKVDVL